MNLDTQERTAIATTPPQSIPSGPPTDPAAIQPSPIQEVKETATEQLRQAAVELKESGGEALQSAKNAGNNFIDEQVEKFATRIDCYTDAVRAACETLETKEGNPLVSPAQRATRQLERAAQYLRTHHAMDFFDDLGALARRKPEIVFGGLFVAGLASVRFLKASSRDRRGSRNGGNGVANHTTPGSYQNASAGPAFPQQLTPHPMS